MNTRIFILILTFFTSCEPGYNCYVRNDSSSTLYLKTRPSIESLYPEKSIYYDSILSYKTGNDGGLSIYEVKPYGNFRIYGNIGSKPSLNEFPFNYIELIQGKDTVVLDNKEKIIARLKQEGKTRKYFIQE